MLLRCKKIQKINKNECALKHIGHFIKKFGPENLSVPCKDNCIKEREAESLSSVNGDTRTMSARIKRIQRVFSPGLWRRSCANFTRVLWGNEKLTADVTASPTSFTSNKKKQRRERNDSLVCPLRGHY